MQTRTVFGFHTRKMMKSLEKKNNFFEKQDKRVPAFMKIHKKKFLPKVPRPKLRLGGVFDFAQIFGLSSFSPEVDNGSDYSHNRDDGDNQEGRA